jgi:hypothetical protein
MYLRRFLLWLLMLAVPWQGIAAATMLLCEPSHHRQQAAAAAAVHDHHHADAGDAHEHPGTHTPGSADVSKSKCSVCASCCPGMALLSAPLTAAVFQQHASYTVFVTTDVETVFIAGPKKPPRAFLA